MSERWGLTRAGLIFCALGIGVGVAAALTRDPLLGCILWGQLATLTAAVVLSRRNLADLTAHRRLPDELFARIPAAGTLVLTNPRPQPAWQVLIQENGASVSARVGCIGSRGRAERTVQWRFLDRGAAALSGLTLRSEHPFGLVFRERRLSCPVRLVVYPEPLGEDGIREHLGAGERDSTLGRSMGAGDFQGLRPYVPGDPVRRLHWPTSARVGQPMVVLTGAQSSRQVVVEVAEGKGAAWEQALSSAAAGIQRHFAAGNAVGLHIGEELLPPRAGGGWRRVLLERLALAARRSS